MGSVNNCTPTQHVMTECAQNELRRGKKKCIALVCTSVYRI